MEALIIAGVVVGLLWGIIMVSNFTLVTLINVFNKDD